MADRSDQVRRNRYYTVTRLNPIGMLFVGGALGGFGLL
jgi:hypothetical protein